MVQITNQLLGGGSGLDFSQLQDALLAGANMSITASATDRTLTFTAVGNFPAGGSIQGASDTNFSTWSDGQILVRSGTNVINVTMSGDATIDRTGAITVGAKKITLSKLSGNGANSGEILIVGANDVVEGSSAYSVMQSVISGGANVNVTTANSKIVVSATQLSVVGGANVTVSTSNGIATVSATDTNTQRTDAEITHLAESAFEAGTGITITTGSSGKQVIATPGTTPADNSVTTSKIADGAVTKSKIGNDSVGLAELDIDGTQAANKVIKVNTTNTGLVFADDNTGGGGGGGVSLTTSNTTTVSLTIASNVISGAVRSNSITATELNVTGNGTSGQSLTSNGDGSFNWTTVTGGGVSDNSIGADQLDVSGDGTLGQFLTSDGDGSFSWTTGSSGSGGAAAGITTTSTTTTSNNAAIAEAIPSGVERIQVDADFNQTTTIAANTTVTMVAELLDGSTVLATQTIFSKVGALATDFAITFELTISRVIGSLSWAGEVSSNMESSPRIISFIWTDANASPDSIRFKFTSPTTPSTPNIATDAIFIATRWTAGAIASGFDVDNIEVGDGLTKTTPSNHVVRIDTKGRIFREAYNLSNNGSTALAVGDRFVRTLASYSANGVWYISGRKATSNSQIPQGRVNQAVPAYSGSGNEVRAIKAIDSNKAVTPLASEIKSGENWDDLETGDPIYVDGNDDWKFTRNETDWLFGKHENGDVIGDWQLVSNRNDVVDDLLPIINEQIAPEYLNELEIIGDYDVVTAEGSLAAGRILIQASGQYKIHLRDSEARKGLALLKRGIDFAAIKDASNLVEGVIRAESASGNVVTLTVNLDSRIVKGTLSNDQNVSVRAYRRVLRKDDLEFSATASLDTHKIATTKWTSDWHTLQKATLAEASSGADVNKFLSPKVNNDTFLLLNGASSITGMAALATNGVPSSDKQFVWSSNTYLMYLSAATYNGVASRLQPGFRYEIRDSGGIIVERGLMTSVSRSGTSLTIVPSSTTIWQQSSTHRGTAGTGYEFRFIGAALYAGEERERNKIQTCQAAYNNGEATVDVATKYRATFGSGSARIGRLGNAARLLNLTLCEHLNSEHLGFRALAGHVYDVSMTVGGTWAFGSAGSGPYGLDFGLQFFL